MSETYLFYDTETTGLPLDWKAHVHDVDNWPRIVQLAYILARSRDEILASSSVIIHNEYWSIPEEATKVHGITDAVAEEQGVDVGFVLGQFNFAQALCTHTVGHNIGFDWKVVGAEMLRFPNMEERYQQFKDLPKICTMRKSTKFVGLKQKNSNRPKYPNLQELHTHLFGEGFEGAHDALADVKATMNCFFELKDIGVI